MATKKKERGGILIRYESQEMEENSILKTAAKMCAAARTAPKARGIDRIETLVLTGEEKDKVADKMEEIGRNNGEGNAFFIRDAENVRQSAAICGNCIDWDKKAFMGMTYCGYCGLENCGNCNQKGGSCVFDYVNLGIDLSSAVIAAQRDFVDNRIMFSIGKTWTDMENNWDDLVWNPFQHNRQKQIL